MSTLGKSRQGTAWPGKARRGKDGKGMRAPFEPIGGQARWKTAYELLATTPMDGIVTYTELGDALGLDPDDDRSTIQQAVHRAAKQHEEDDKRAIDVIPGKGYRIVEPAEHLTLARRHQRKAGRSLVRGHSKAVNVDLNGVEPEVRRALEVVAQAFSMQMDFNRRFDVRQARLEQAVRDITDAQAMDRKRTEEEVAELKERLARLESTQ
jgi:hypothetical protein